MTGTRLNPLDEVFLWWESRETMMHVAGLMHFTPPADAPPDYVRTLGAEIREERSLTAPWNLKLRNPAFPAHPLQTWVEDTTPDVDYHVRRSALPTPGDERELGVLISRLHSHPVDLSRPPWEAHFIEGLEGGRLALYVKAHHSLTDGFTAMRLLRRSLSTEAADRNKPMFFALPDDARPIPASEVEESPDFWSLFATLRGQVGWIKSVGTAIVDLGLAQRRHDVELISPLQAPVSVLNARIGRNRRFATQQYEIERLKELAQRAGGTLNDIVLAICAGGLRRFLLELGELPEKPLVALLPVSVRPKDDPGGGNAVGAILASLATDVADPRKRLDTIMATTFRAKEQLRGLTRSGMLAYSAALMTPSVLQLLGAKAGIHRRLPMTFNLVISNVPGPLEPLYFRGARMDVSYPVSIAMHGMALNISCQSYAGTLGFGFIGCRDTLPHLQRLAVYTGEALAEIEAAVGA